MAVELPAEAKAALDRFIAEHGGPGESAIVLWNENRRYRQKSRELEAELARVSNNGDFRYRDKAKRLQRELDDASKLVPKDGTVVLSAEDAVKWQAFQDLKLAPTELAKAVEERTGLRTEVSTLKEDQVGRDAAADLGLKFEVLRKVIKAEGLVVERKEVDVTVDGKMERQWQSFVRPSADEKAAPEPLATALETGRLKDYGPALKQEPGSGGGSGGEVRIPAQVPASGKAPGKVDLATKHVESKYPSPAQLRKTNQQGA